MIQRRKQRGYLLVTVIITLFLVASVAVLLAHDSANSANTSSRELETARVDYVAQAGLQHSLWRAQNSACMGEVTIPDTALGKDKYSATIKAAATGTLVKLSADQDAWIRSDDVSRNNGTTTWNHVRNEVAGTEQVLTRFDLSSLAAKAQISSAVAWFHIKALTPHPEGSITIHEITADWAETAVTWESFAGAYGSSTIGMIPAQDTGDVWVAVNLTAQVQAWVNGQPNYGILFDPQADGTHAEYTAREDGSNPPRLEVVVGSGASSPVTIKVKGELDNGVKRALKAKIVPAYQPPSITTLQLGTDPGMDAILDSFYERNYGGANYLQINNDGSWIQRPVLRFELATVPQGAKVVSAQLELRRLSVNAPGSATVHRLTRSFVGGTKAGGGVADGATWATYDGINSWSSAGGDYDAAVVAKTYIDGSEDWVSWDIGPLVDAWVNGEPNNGLLIDGANGLKQAKFASQEDSDPAVRPKLTITYVCECGSVCLSPRGSGNVVMVVINPTTLVPADAYKKALFESWGYTVDVISESANQAEYDAKAASGDVFFISETVNSNQVGNKLLAVPIGVVSQDGSYNSDLGLAGGSAWPVGPTINVTDTSHFITAIFPAGPLDIFSGAMEQLAVSGGAAAGLQTLADTGGAGSLVALDTGAALLGSGSAAGRRVMLPLGREGRMNWDYLNGNGRLVVQRSLAWAMKADGGVTGKNVLLVVADAVTLAAQDAAKQTLIEGWGHTVNLIDDNADQTEFDAAYAVNDVAYVSEEILTGALDTKLRNAYIGVVFEEQKIPDELGVSSGESVYFETSIDITDNTHYITETLSTGALTIVSSSQEVGALGGTLAPDLQILAQRPSSTLPTLAVIEKGGALFDGGTAEGRRAKVPWGGNTFDINALTADGQTIMKRAIEWGAGAGVATCASTTPLMFVVSDDTAPTSQETARQTLLESWCFAVKRMDDGASQAEYDAEIAIADVVYISPEALASQVGDKLKDSATGIVNEDPDLHNDFGFSTVRYRSTTNAPISTDASHYITETFGGADITLFDSTQPAGAAVGTLPSGLVTLGSWTSGDLSPLGGLLTLETGATISGGGTAAGRRVQLPWDGAEGGAVADIGALTADGETVLQRSLEWAAGADGVAAPAPIAHWKFDETSGTTAVDSEGGHDGTLIGDASWASGMVDGGLSLDGSGDRVEVSGLIGSPSTLTIAVWVNLSTVGASGAEVVSLGDNILLRLDNWLYDTYVSFWDGSSWRRTTSSESFSGSGWRHIAYTHDDAADQQFLFIDGVEAAATTFTTSISYTQASNTTIGAQATGNSSYDFNGQIDDLRVYDYALSPTEIAALAAGGGGGGGGGGTGGGGGPGPAFEAFAEASLASNGTSLNIAKPGGTTTGDLLIAALVTDGDSGDSFSPPSGWTEVSVGPNANGRVSLGVWWRIADGSEPAQYSFTWSGSEQAYGWVMRFTNHDPANPVYFNNGMLSSTNTSLNPIADRVTPPVDNALVLRIGGFDDDDIDVGEPGLDGHTDINMGKSGTGSNSASGGAGYLVQATASDTGLAYFALTNAEEYRTVTLVVRPAP